MGYALGCTSHEMLWLAVMGIGGAGVEETAGMAGVPPSTELLAPERRAQLLRRGLWLEYATLGWNVVEIGFLVAAAVAAQSVALAGFALDSFIEIFASLVVVGQLRGTATPDGERRALRRIGLAFFGIALYIAAQAVVTLISGVEPDSSALGIGWLAATCVVMFGLAAGKARTATRSGIPCCALRLGSPWSTGRWRPGSWLVWSSTRWPAGGGRMSQPGRSSSSTGSGKDATTSGPRTDPTRRRGQTRPHRGAEDVMIECPERDSNPHALSSRRV
jgi:hypothetical protein